MTTFAKATLVHRSAATAPMLDAAALDAVRQWGYTPTLLNGVPVPVVMSGNRRFPTAA